MARTCLITGANRGLALRPLLAAAESARVVHLAGMWDTAAAVLGRLAP